MEMNSSTDYLYPVHPFTRLRPWLGVLIMVFAVFFVYAPSLDGGFLWGDELFVTENDAVGVERGLRQIWFNPQSIPGYEPLVQTTFWIQYRLHGANPEPFRILNLILHIFNGLLLLALLRYLKVPGAWLVVALFLFHPIQVASVAWIARRTNTLSLLFYLASLFLFCRAYRLGEESTDRPSALLFSGGVVGFLCALFSNAIALTLPVTLLLILWWKRVVIDGKLRLQMLSLIVFGLVAGLFVARLGGAFAPAHGAHWDLTGVECWLLAGRMMWFYVGKLLLPIDFAFIYPLWEIESGLPALFFPLSALVVVVVLWIFRAPLGRGPLAAVLFYVITLMPALLMLPADSLSLSFVADHVSYHAGIGLLVLFSGCLAVLAKRMASTMFEREKEFTRAVFGSLMLPVLVVLGMLSWRQAQVYHNEIALWRDTIERNPSATIAYNHLAVILHREGRLPEADQLLRRSVEENPDVLEAPFNSGRLLQEMGRFEEAADYYTRALKIDPDHVATLSHRGYVLLRLGRHREALEHLTRAVRIQPDFAEAHQYRASALAFMGRLEEALDAYERTVALDPDNTRARFRMGILLYRQQRFDEAVRVFRETLAYEAEHADALNNLGLSLSQLGRPGDALPYYDRAVNVRPNFAQAWHNRGVAFERLGRYDDAEESYRRALVADPSFAPAERNLRQLELTRPLR